MTQSARSGTAPIVLASGSPRRREILTQAGLDFVVIPPQVEEVPLPGEAPLALATRLATEKALAVARQVGPGAGLVLGADTIVVLGDRVIGKPRDAEDAVDMLRALTGCVHRVITGIAVADPARLVARTSAVESSVHMRAADDDEIRDYIALGESLDKAGAYALQGEGGRRFVTAVEGSQTNVIGLPIEETRALLDAARAAVEESGA
jgi:septum formation protein